MQYGNLWKSMEIYGNLWTCMEMYGNVWKCMELYLFLLCIARCKAVVESKISKYFGPFWKFKISKFQNILLFSQMVNISKYFKIFWHKFWNFKISKYFAPFWNSFSCLGKIFLPILKFWNFKIISKYFAHFGFQNCFKTFWDFDILLVGGVKTSKLSKFFKISKYVESS